MNLTQEDVLQIIRIMDKSDYAQLHLELGELKLTVKKNGIHSFSQDEQELPLPVLADVPKKAKESAQSDSPAGKSDPRENAGMADEPHASEGLIPIRSPMLGTFYSAPKPGDPAFVEVGQVVDESTTLCIIEVMKLFSTIHAGVKGRIAKICAEDSQMVEYDQILFLIAPQTDEGEG